MRICRRPNHSTSHAHDTQLGRRSLPTARQPHLLTAHEPTAPAHAHRSPSSRSACTGSAQRPYALEEGSAGAPASQAAALQPTGSPEPEPEPEPGAPTALQPTAGASSSRRLLIATLLCIFCGGLGAHHLYLGRNVAALQCLLTFNYFGLGLPLDLLRMRGYVRELVTLTLTLPLTPTLTLTLTLTLTVTQPQPQP